MSVHVSRHPLLLHHLTRLRDRTTETPEFRALVKHPLVTMHGEEKPIAVLVGAN